MTQTKSLIPVAKAAYLNFAKRATRILIPTCIIAFIASGGMTGAGAHVGGMIFDWIGGIAAFAIMFIWIPPILALSITSGLFLGDQIALAARPLPSPAQIAAQLEAEWGRPPTVEEVAAVHQMLTNQHNQALLNSGIGLGALYMIDKNLHQ